MGGPWPVRPPLFLHLYLDPRLDVPVRFAIKSRPAFVYGAVHLFRLMHLVKTQSAVIRRSAVTETVERNAYYAHPVPENLLVAMVSDSETSVRGEGVDKLLAAKKQNSGTMAGSSRHFRVPMLNWEAESYPDMIKWEETNVTEPPHCGPASQFRANLIARATFKNLLAMWLNASEIV